jgi:hypothetical protein
MPNKKNAENAEFFYCNLCDFSCSKPSNYDRHLLTLKHKILTNPNEKNAENIYQCECGKKYKHKSTLSAHKKICNIQVKTLNNTNNNIVDVLLEQNIKLSKETNELREMLVIQNKEFREIIIDVCKQMKPTIITNNNNTNSHNKTFNLNVFLNETCKDAMNIMDFVDSLKLQLSDLEIVGKLGFVEGISNIIVKNLKALDITQRPVHCSDSKREVVYVKDDNKWEKENEEKIKLRKAIKKIAYKNSILLSEFKAKHPDCIKSESKYSDQYNKLIIEAMGGRGDNDIEKEDKIIRKIAKEVTIDKYNFCED